MYGRLFHSDHVTPSDVIVNTLVPTQLFYRRPLLIVFFFKCSWTVNLLKYPLVQSYGTQDRGDGCHRRPSYSFPEKKFFSFPQALLSLELLSALQIIKNSSYSCSSQLHCSNQAKKNSRCVLSARRRILPGLFRQRWKTSTALSSFFLLKVGQNRKTSKVLLS